MPKAARKQAFGGDNAVGDGVGAVSLHPAQFIKE